MSDISYDWNFNKLGVIYNEDVLQNVVHTVHWQYIAMHPSASQQVIGTVLLEAPTSASFIPFESLTKETVTFWVEAKLGESVIMGLQTNLSQSLNKIIFPTGGQLAPPWNAP